MLDSEKPADGVTERVRAELRVLGVPAKLGGGELAVPDFAVTAGWGRSQNAGPVMPGRGKAEERDYTPEEIKAFGASSGRLGLSPSRIIELLGERTLDVYLNADAYWSNVPENVWTYKLGGYQVIKKWLSYREKDILRRPLKLEEVQEVSGMIRRIAAIILMTPALNANYRAIEPGGADDLSGT